MPQLGKITTGKELGKKNHYRLFVWVACVDCGDERWVMYINSQLVAQRCRRCAHIRALQDPLYIEKIRKALLGQKHSPERVEANRLGQIKRFQRPEERLKASIAGSMPQPPRTPEHCAKISANVKKRWDDPEWRAKMSLILKEAANRPEVKEKTLQRLRDALNKHIKPNKPETRLLNLLNTHFPGQWEYTGNWEFMIGHKNPDFIHTDGHKQVIELFGAYWHDIFDVAKTVEFYRQYGFSALVIWEDELKDEGKVVAKIGKFMRVTK